VLGLRADPYRIFAVVASMSPSAALEAARHHGLSVEKIIDVAEAEMPAAEAQRIRERLRYLVRLECQQARGRD
jgi:hypothetical protein